MVEFLGCGPPTQVYNYSSLTPRCANFSKGSAFSNVNYSTSILALSTAPAASSLFRANVDVLGDVGAEVSAHFASYIL